MWVVPFTPSVLRGRAVEVPAVLTAAALTAAVLSLSACSSSDNASGSSSNTSAAGSPSPSASADGVALTDPGTRLGFGESATVEHRVAGESSILKLTVKSARKGSVKDLSGFALDNAYKKNGNYFYVDVSVANKGTTKTGGYPVPLWGISGQDTLLQPVSFTTNFAPCPSKDLPNKFKPGDKLTTCLVFLSPNHGSLKGVSYRPSESFVPIEWHGKVESGKQSKKGNKSHQKGKPKKGKP
jgi:hypothetical protein